MDGKGRALDNQRIERSSDLQMGKALSWRLRNRTSAPADYKGICGVL